MVATDVLTVAFLREQAARLIEPERDYSVWSPDAAFGAADVLLRSLADHEKRP